MRQTICLVWFNMSCRLHPKFDKIAILIGWLDNKNICYANDFMFLSMLHIITKEIIMARNYLHTRSQNIMKYIQILSKHEIIHNVQSVCMMDDSLDRK